MSEDSKKSAPKKSAKGTLETLVSQGEADDAVREALEMSDEERARALADRGFDVRAERARAKEMQRELEARAPREAEIVPLHRARRARAGVVLLVAASLAAMFLFFVGRNPGIDGPHITTSPVQVVDASDDQG
jgi:hypothetical protein